MKTQERVLQWQTLKTKKDKIVYIGLITCKEAEQCTKGGNFEELRRGKGRLRVIWIVGAKNNMNNWNLQELMTIDRNNVRDE